MRQQHNNQQQKSIQGVTAGKGLALCGLTLLAACGISWVVQAHVAAGKAATEAARRARSYTPAGYGGYTSPPTPLLSAQRAKRGETGLEREACLPAIAKAKVDPVRAVRDAYRAGHYGEVETRAAQLQKAEGMSTKPTLRKQAAEAGLIAAYAAARRQDFVLARDRFEAVRQEAEALPDHGAPPFVYGELQPTLEAEAAFEHAVCTGKIDGPAKAEEEYRAFLQDEPQSVLVHAAIKRIAHLHKGDIPRDAEKLWKQAMAVQAQAQKKEKRQESLCGPEVVAELLHRQGKKAEVEALAGEMHTSEEGTSLKNLAAVATKHGLPLKGLMLTQAGLLQLRLPVVALVKPGHFVLVEQTSAESVSLWDPDKNGVGKAGTERCSVADWQGRWSGVTLATK